MGSREEAFEHVPFTLITETKRDERPACHDGMVGPLRPGVVWKSLKGARALQVLSAVSRAKGCLMLGESPGHDSTFISIEHFDRSDRGNPGLRGCVCQMGTCCWQRLFSHRAQDKL
ncbi:hypothetical protein AAFF_G00030180 [Aldrovandia affinis]|uniref:Uncharacterized protein n=1 Tax=Aldrovandia affinis TaxID=143900 RepID=A0AAD7S414_9TELE|nr:hypothetical protein AAFF_G00030180 [Aldrovandia affinis]